MQKSKLQVKNQILPKGWRKVKLEDWITLKYGFGLPEKERRKGDVQVYGSSGIVGWHNKAAVNKKGIIVGRKGNVGAIYFSDKPFYPIDTVYFVDSLKKNGDLKFFFYLLKTINFQRVDINVGVPGLNRETAHSLEIFIPEDSKEQKRIAAILSAFDDKIELNNKISRTLEEMASAIFKEWFVKFNFPVELVKSEKLKVKNEKLETICDIVYGKDLPTRNLKKYGFPVYGGNGIIGYSDKYLYSEPQIIVGCRGAYSGNVFKTEPKSFITHNSLVLKIKEGKNIGINYLFYALQKSNVKSSTTGSAQPQITITELNKVEIPTADDKLTTK
ncbi:MAG: hypothetical protein COX43_01590, partial [Parcubacteria group bacterium CG23_combo_of_CG06-09_8_20_14_all_35_9]